MTNLPTAATCHRSAARTSPGFARRWRIPIVIGGVMLAGMGAALWQQWLTLAALAPLLFVLSCAVMMFVCMRHMNHSQPSDQTSAAAERAGRADVRG